MEADEILISFYVSMLHKATLYKICFTNEIRGNDAMHFHRDS